MKKQKNYLILGISLLILSVSLGFGCSFIYKTKKKEEPPIYNEIDNEKEEPQEPLEEEPVENTPVPYDNILPSIRNQYGNNNIVGKLEIPNIGIDSYVTRAADNSYYLGYNYYNQYDALGVPFVDYRNTDLGNNQQINLYGHNTQNEKYFNHLPFIKLESYTNKNIFDSYKDIYLSIDEKKMHYRVIAIKIIDDSNNEHMKVIFKSKNDYLIHVSRLLQNSLYRDNMIEISSTDRLIVLQVCHYNPMDTYLLVIGKEVKD